MAINNTNAYVPGMNQYGAQQPGFVGQTYGNFTNQTYSSQPMMNTASRPGLSVVSIDSDEQVTNHPVAAGNTVMFVNFNTNRLCFKTTNQNAVPMPLQWASFVYDQPVTNYPQNQNGGQNVSREEFDELKAMLQRTLDAVQNQNYRRNKHDKPKGGFRDDRPADISADDE